MATAWLLAAVYILVFPKILQKQHDTIELIIWGLVAVGTVVVVYEIFKLLKEGEKLTGSEKPITMTKG